jgi:hypothetical protein
MLPGEVQELLELHALGLLDTARMQGGNEGGN